MKNLKQKMQRCLPSGLEGGDKAVVPIIGDMRAGNNVLS
jgi:hypothetical protein